MLKSRSDSHNKLFIVLLQPPYAAGYDVAPLVVYLPPELLVRPTLPDFVKAHHHARNRQPTYIPSHIQPSKVCDSPTPTPSLPDQAHHSTPRLCRNRHRPSVAAHLFRGRAIPLPKQPHHCRLCCYLPRQDNSLSPPPLCPPPTSEDNHTKLTSIELSLQQTTSRLAAVTQQLDTVTNLLHALITTLTTPSHTPIAALVPHLSNATNISQQPLPMPHPPQNTPTFKLQIVFFQILLFLGGRESCNNSFLVQRKAY